MALALSRSSGGGSSTGGSLPSATTTTIDVTGEALAVASGSPITVVSYTVPMGKEFFLSLVDFSGENVAKFSVNINGAPHGLFRTYFTEYNGSIYYDRHRVNAGEAVVLTVEHGRPTTADFNGRIVGWELDA